MGIVFKIFVKTNFYKRNPEITSTLYDLKFRNSFWISYLQKKTNISKSKGWKPKVYKLINLDVNFALLSATANQRREFMKILLFDYKSFGSKYILLRISVNTNVPNLVQVDSNSLDREHGMVRADRKTAPADRGFRGRGMKIKNVHDSNTDLD